VLHEVYGELVRVASAVSRSHSEARDLVQSVLLDAIERGIGDLSEPERRAWLYGALRRRAAFDARTAGRARRREARWLEATPDRSGAGGGAPQPWRFSRDFLERLAPSLRTLAALASAELQPSEIRSVLRLSDTAFRKRVSMLRRAVHHASAIGVSLVTAPSQAFALGKKRAQLIADLRRHPGWAIASHDPDGHPLIFSTAGAHEKAPAGNSV
jgi:DNA-directed RNA polymerase specialized sigma24 family protein